MTKSPGGLATGDEVEVICQDEGFFGAFYEARIVRSLSKPRRFTVEYETLVDDFDSSKKVRETVNAAHVRPRPPRGSDSSFEVGQSVDALYNEGWWAGEVAEILEGGKRYKLSFSGCKEKMEFALEEVRVHMDWVDREWVLPQPQDLCGIKSDTLAHFLKAIRIAHKSKVLPLSSTSDGSEKEPCRSKYSGANFDGKLLDGQKLEASQPFEESKNGGATPDNLHKLQSISSAKGVKTGVKSGFEITTPAIEERINSHLYHLMDTQPCSTRSFKEHSVLNPATLSSTLLGKINDEQTIPVFSNQQLVLHAPSSIDERSIMEGDGSTMFEDVGFIDAPEASKFNLSTNYSPDVDVEKPRKKVVAAPKQGEKSLLCGGSGKYATVGKRKNMRGRSKKRRVVYSVVANEGTELDKLGKKHALVPEIGKQLVPTKCNTRKVRIIATKDLVEGLEPNKSKVYHEEEHNDGNMQVDSLPEIQRESNNQVAEEARLLSNEGICILQLETSAQGLADVAIDSTTGETEKLAEPKEDGKKAEDEHHPLSGYQLADMIDINRTEAGNALDNEETVSEAPLLAGEITAQETNTGGLRILTYRSSERNTSCLPFAKTSPLWKLIKSLEVFSSVSQEPHFRPLEQYAEEYREGMAIGLMVTFANLVSDIRKLRITDPEESLEEKMNTLLHLEGYGFNMQLMRHLLEKLQRIKRDQKHLSHKRSSLGESILERKTKKSQLNAKFEENENVIMELEKAVKPFRDRKASILIQMEDNECETAKLQHDMMTVEESFLAAETEFQGALSAVEAFVDPRVTLSS